MKSSAFRIFAFFVTVLAFSIAPSLAFGQWRPDSSENTPVCDTASQQEQVQGCTDGANGAIFVWQDSRGSVTQIYAQHLDSNGRIKWNRTGLKLATAGTGASSIQTNPIITTDDSGGAYVVWLDTRNSNTNGTCLFSQHILANGTLAYPDTGLPVAIGLNGCLSPTLCDDGFGGAYVAWEDNRACNAQTRPDIWMNHLWRNSVKYGLTTAGPAGELSSVTINTGTYYHPKYVTTYYFHDPNANFECYMVGLDLNIPGKGSYVIDSIASTSDTQLYLKTHPDDTGAYAYSVGNLTGLAIDTMTNKQTGPALVNDGQGGSFLAWVTNATSPNSIYGTHLDSTCTAWWDPAPQPGFQLYINPNTNSPSKNVVLNRDGNQLLLAWQVTNGNNLTSQEIFAQRMRCMPVGTGPGAPYRDTTFLWADAAVVTSSLISQTNPQIFSDDSTALGIRGLLVPFIDNEQGVADNYEISMVRVLGNGLNLEPPAGFWFLEQKPQMHNDLQAIKITDPANANNNGILAVWDDASDPSGDTMLFTQRMDRNGRNYFPTPGTSNTWGECISGDAASGQKWDAKQPCLVPRANGDGGIVAWTDYRSGIAAIYAQLILMNGALWIPSDTNPPALEVQSRSPSDDTSLCNSQCTTVLAVDTGFIISGIASIDTMGMNNMYLDVPDFTKGTHSVTFSVCVVDSLFSGSGTIVASDTAGNAQTMNFTYCTISDTSHPVITWDSLTGPYWLVVHVSDNGPWNRGLRSVTVSDSSNVKVISSGVTVTSGEGEFDDSIRIVNDSIPAQFWIQAIAADGNSSGPYKFYYTSPTAGVTQPVTDPISISVFPNPINGDATVQLEGAPSADVTVLDVLGRTVDQFRLEGSHEWQASSLPQGTYIVRAIVGDVIVCKRVVRE